jgi:hypothetical protein
VAALSHLQIAIRHFGYAYEVESFPDSDNKDLLTRVILDGRREPVKEDLEPKESVISKLRSIVAEEGQVEGGEGETTIVWLHIAKEGEKNSLADLIAQGDRIQLSDKRFRRELASWIHSNRGHSKDGMPGYAFGFSNIMSHMGPFVLRTFDIGKRTGSKRPANLL